MTSAQEYLEEIGTLALLASDGEYRATTDYARQTLAVRLGEFDTLPQDVQGVIRSKTLEQLNNAPCNPEVWFQAEVNSLSDPTTRERARAFTWALCEACRRFLMEEVLHVPIPTYRKKARPRIALAH